MKAGTIVLLVAWLGGLWVMASPYIIGFSPKHGNPWTGMVLGTEVLGALVTATATVVLAGFWTAYLKGQAKASTLS